MCQNVWENDDFIFKGDELKGMTAKGKDKVKTQGFTDMVIPATTPEGVAIKRIGDNAFYRRGLTSVVIPDTVETIGYDAFGVCKLTEVKLPAALVGIEGDRKSTRLNSSHANISYAVFCLKKKKI